MVIDELVEWGWRWRPLVVLGKDDCCKEAEEEKQNKICQCGSKLAAGQHRAVIYAAGEWPKMEEPCYDHRHRARSSQLVYGCIMYLKCNDDL